MNINVARILDTELETLYNEIIARQRAAGQVATGRTIRLYSYKLITPNHGVLEGAKYLSTLENGRGPAKAGDRNTKYEFIANLKRWIQAKGIDYGGTPDKLERLANFFRWYMNKKGNKMFRNGIRKDIYTTPMNKFIERVTSQVALLYQTEITKNI